MSTFHRLKRRLPSPQDILLISVDAVWNSSTSSQAKRVVPTAACEKAKAWTLSSALEIRILRYRTVRVSSAFLETKDLCPSWFEAAGGPR